MQTPGVRFEELLYYLLRKIFGNDYLVSAIAVNDCIYSSNPWDLPASAAIPSPDTWPFVSRPEPKNRKRGGINRVTSAGSWRGSGRPREVKNGAKNQVIGLKKIFVFYRGRGRTAENTGWVIHEYQLHPSYSNGSEYVICLLKSPKNNEGGGGGSPSEVVTSVTDITLPEIDPQFMVECLESNVHDLTYQTAQHPEMYMSQVPDYVNLEHTSGITNDYNMPLCQFGDRDQIDNNREAVNLYPATLNAQYCCGMNTGPDDSTHSLQIGDSIDTEAVKSRVDGYLPEMHSMKGLSDENLQQTNGEVISPFPGIQNVGDYCGIFYTAPIDSSPSESLGSLHVEDIIYTEPPLFDSYFETSPGVDSGCSWDGWLFEPASAYFPQT